MSFARKAILVLAVGALSISQVPQEATAAAGSNVIEQARVAEGGVDRCSASTQGQALIDCVAGVMGRFSSGVNRGEAPSKAPQILTITAEASTIRGKPKAEALRVLNKVIAVANGLASKGSGDFGPAYSSVARVFTRAVGVIERKG